MAWLGYERADGSYGARNYVLIYPTGIVADTICHFVEGVRTVVVASTPSGPSEDQAMFSRLCVGLGRNPNVASVIIDCTGLYWIQSSASPESLAEEIAKSGKRVELIGLGREDTMSVIGKGVKLARQMVYEASNLRRQPVDDSHLTVGVKCGSSDATSGIAGNPVVGYVYDKLVEAGGTAMFGETTEVIGAEHLLVKRAINPKVADEILRAVRSNEERAKATGEDIRGQNPSPVNIKAGLSSIEEKSLGAIYKSGSMPIQGVLKYAERPKEKGLYFVDNWPARTSIFMGYAAAGAQIVLFQLGGGAYHMDGPLYNPATVKIAPLIWCSANPRTRELAMWNLDFSSAPVIEGKESIEEAGERLYATILKVASGTMTRTETLKYVEPTEAYAKTGPF
ncbi:MAG: UxaA family hydrolase [Candidatus Bathyarchaeota archaeon]|nr:UxaA family hydrolase [Candidatus Bathyarchaeota archaeon]